MASTTLPAARSRSRALLKAIAEWALTTRAARRILELQGARTVILAYHNVVPDRLDAGGSRGLHLGRRRFGRQLDALLRTHDVVRLTDALEADGAARTGRPLAVITFDDAYAGALTVGLEELAERNLPATVFVAPGLLGTDAFWWDALVQEDEADLPGPIRRHAMTELAGRTERIWAWAKGAGRRWTVPPRPARPADERLLAAAVAGGGVDLAPHGWAHANLMCLSAGEVEEEISSSLAWLRERFSRVVPVLAYPYGLWSPDTAAAARRAGCVGAVRAEGGRLPRRGADPFAVPRVAIPAGLSRRGFALRTGAAVDRS